MVILHRSRTNPLMRGLPLILLLLAWTTENFAAPKDIGDLETIGQALEAYTSTIQTLRGCFRWRRTPPNAAMSRPGQTVSEDLTSVVDFELDRVNNRRRFDERRTWIFSRFSGEPFEDHRIHVFDGMTTYSLSHTYTRDPTNVGMPVDVPVTVRRSSGDAWPGLSPEHVAGLRLYRFGSSLAELLQTQRATYEGRERLDGAEFDRVSIPIDDRKIALVVWLDRQRGFLPRRQEWIHLGEPRQPPDHNDDVLETFEFREFPVPGGDAVWFPARSQLRTRADILERLEILELEINPAIEPERFRFDPADLPDGVLVPGPDGTSIVTGGREDLWRERSELFDKHDDIIRERLGLPEPTAPPLPPMVPTGRPSTSPPAPADTPQPAAWADWLIVAVVAVLLFAAARMFLRSRSRT